jgi:hypothetical protein
MIDRRYFLKAARAGVDLLAASIPLDYGEEYTDEAESNKARAYAFGQTLMDSGDALQAKVGRALLSRLDAGEEPHAAVDAVRHEIETNDGDGEDWWYR